MNAGMLLVHHDPFLLGERAHAALHLPRLGGLGAEPLDEALDTDPFGRLARGAHFEVSLLLVALSTIVVVGAVVSAQPFGLERQHTRDLAVQELAIMADEQERLAGAAQK